MEQSDAFLNSIQHTQQQIAAESEQIAGYFTYAFHQLETCKTDLQGIAINFSVMMPCYEDDVVPLNVGGRDEDLRVDVLDKSLFGCLLKKEWRSLLLQDAQGRYFLDVDFQWIEPILIAMAQRQGEKVIAPPLDAIAPHLRHGYTVMLDYFQIKTANTAEATLPTTWVQRTDLMQGLRVGLQDVFPMVAAGQETMQFEPISFGQHIPYSNTLMLITTEDDVIGVFVEFPYRTGFETPAKIFLLDHSSMTWLNDSDSVSAGMWPQQEEEFYFHHDESGHFAVFNMATQRGHRSTLTFGPGVAFEAVSVEMFQLSSVSSNGTECAFVSKPLFSEDMGYLLDWVDDLSDVSDMANDGMDERHHGRYIPPRHVCPKGVRHLPSTTLTPAGASRATDLPAKLLQHYTPKCTLLAPYCFHQQIEQLARMDQRIAEEGKLMLAEICFMDQHVSRSLSLPASSLELYEGGFECEGENSIVERIRIGMGKLQCLAAEAQLCNNTIHCSSSTDGPEASEMPFITEFDVRGARIMVKRDSLLSAFPMDEPNLLVGCMMSAGTGGGGGGDQRIYLDLPPVLFGCLINYVRMHALIGKIAKMYIPKGCEQETSEMLEYLLIDPKPPIVSMQATVVESRQGAAGCGQGAGDEQ